jgi:hypothetical protein
MKGMMNIVAVSIIIHSIFASIFVQFGQAGGAEENDEFTFPAHVPHHPVSDHGGFILFPGHHPDTGKGEFS